MPANEPVDHRRNVEQADMRLHNVETFYQQSGEDVGDGRYVRRGVAAIAKIIYEMFLFASAGAVRVCTDVQPDNDTDADSYSTADGAGTWPRLQYGETCRLTALLTQGDAVTVDQDLRNADRLIDAQQYLTETGRAIYTMNLNIASDGTPATSVELNIGIDRYFAGDELGAIDRATVPVFDFHPLSPFYYYAAGTFILAKSGGALIPGWLRGLPSAGPLMPFQLITPDGNDLGASQTLENGDTLHLEGNFMYARFTD